MSLKFYTLIIFLLISNLNFAQYSITVLNTPTVLENFTSFNGTGFQPTPAAGQLDSDGWAVTGWSDGNLAFGGTNVVGDYARGTTTGGVTTGGMYKNTLLTGFMMIQPGSSDFAPGTITMRVQNNTGFIITDFDLNYLLLNNNNEGRANSFNFSYSTDGINFTAVTALNFTSPEAADALGWQSVTRNTSVGGLNISNGGFLYLRWNSADVSGAGSRDEFGLDDIELTMSTLCVPESEPTVNASGISFSATCSSVDINFTSGNGANRIVVMSQTCPIAVTPTDQTDYTARSFGLGSAIGAGNFVVYNGNASSVRVGGLLPGTTYCFSIFEYNGTDSSCTENYLAAGVVSNTFTTNSTGCLDGGIIVNEYSNGSVGEQEYMEFLVVGDPCSTVDLRGWIFDDNNGFDNASCEGFAINDCSSGIAPGHARFANILRWAAVPVGSLILVYNSADKNLSITFADDPTDANGDLVYVLPITDPGIEGTSALPSSPMNCTSGIYAPGNCAYSPVTYSTPVLWDRISLNNSTDACQTRRPDGSFFHGFSYGTTNMTGGPYGINFNTPGTGRNFYLNCGHYTLLEDYSTGIAPTNETPGISNNTKNDSLVNYYRGTYGCGVVPPCVTLLNVKLQAFHAKKEERAARLDWQLGSSDTEYFTFELQRSSDAINFYRIAIIEGQSNIESYLHYDREPMSKNYYRLKMVDANGEVTYSQIRNVDFNLETDVLLYPNPLRGSRQLNIFSESNIDEVEIYNALGQKVYSVMDPVHVINLPEEISAGFYSVVIKILENEIIRKLIIE
jgi:hypothetical protein